MNESNKDVLEDEKIETEDKKEKKSDQQKEEKQDNKKDKKNKLQEKIIKLELENKELKDKLLRELAETENFKKRLNLERINEKKYASLNLISELLTHLDNLDLAVNMETDNDILKNFLIGFKMINNQLFEVLKKDGLKEIEALNKSFNEQYHQAIETVEIADKEDGIIVEVLKKGYVYKDRVVKPSMVKVNKIKNNNEEMN